jgi:hypothetical protein
MSPASLMAIVVSASSEESPLLRLPRELRDQIYDTCLHDSCVRIDHIDFFTVLSYDGTKDAVRGWPRWLLTNKQLLHEGFEQFYRQAIGIECEQRTAQTDLKKSKPRKGEEGTNLLQEYTNLNPFLGLHQLRAVELNDIQMRYYTKYMAVGRPPATLYISSLHTILPLRRWLALHQGSLKALKLTFRRPMLGSYMPLETDWEVEMSQLENLAKLDRAEFAIYDSGHTFAMIEDPSTVASAVVRMKAELRRICNTLVPHDDGDPIMREWSEYKEEVKTRIQGRIEEWHVEVTRCVKKA